MDTGADCKRATRPSNQYKINSPKQIVAQNSIFSKHVRLLVVHSDFSIFFRFSDCRWTKYKVIVYWHSTWSHDKQTHSVSSNFAQRFPICFVWYDEWCGWDAETLPEPIKFRVRQLVTNTRGKSLWELRVTTFLPNWQPPLICSPGHVRWNYR